MCHSLRKRERSWVNLRHKICGFLEKPQMDQEKFFFLCQARFLDKFPSITFLWISCNLPNPALKNLAGLWICRRNKIKVAVRRRVEKRPPTSVGFFFLILVESYQVCEEDLAKMQWGQRECQMEANAGEAWGRNKSGLPASNWYATSHHIPIFFPSY